MKDNTYRTALVLAKESIHQPQPKHPVSYREAKTLLKMSFRDCKG